MSLFVGRESELAALTAGLEDAFAGHGRLFLISGEPGIGKSRLAEELAGRARERGAAVLVGRCWEAGGAPPFWPWVQVIRARLRDRDPALLRAELGRGASDLAQIVPELRDLFPDIPAVLSTESDAARFRLFDAVASFLGASSREQPLVLALDDLHAADDPSLLLLRFVAGQLADARVLVLSAYRDVDPTPSDPLGATLAELVREPVTTNLPLRGLGEADIAGLIEVTTDQKPSAQLVEALHAGTEGNPLFVGEIVRLLATEGRLDDAVDSLAIPPSVTEVITRRLTRLTPECRRVLGVASVLGRDFDVEVLAQLHATNTDSLSAQIEEAVGQRLLSDAPSTSRQRRFSHVLVRDALYDGLQPELRKELHLRAVAELVDAYAEEPGPHLAELAHHAFAGGDVEGGMGYAQAAGDRALGLLAYEEAARLYEMALAAATDEGSRCDLLLALGRALQRSGEAERAKQAFLEAAELARRLGRREALARSALGYAGRFAWGRAGSDEKMIPLLREGLAAAEDDLALRARLLGRLAAAMGDEPDIQPRAELSRQSIEIARATKDPSTVAYALVARYAATWAPDNQDERLAIADEIIELAAAASDDEREIEGHGYRFHALLELGDVDAARAELSARGALTEKMKQPAQRWIQLILESGVSLLTGDFDAADDSIHRAFELGSRTYSASHARADFDLSRFVLRREQGRLHEIEAELEESARARPWRLLYQCALANLCAELGRSTEAGRRLAALAADDFGRLSRDGDWLLAMALLSETSGVLGDVSSAAKLHELLSPLARVCVGGWPEAPTGAVARYLGIAASTMSRWDDAERHFEAALETNERIGARPWLAHTQHDYASMLLARGHDQDREKAAGLLESALTKSRQLGMNPLADKVSALLSALEPTKSAQVPTFAHYRIEGEIGRGGMGVVYRATDLQLERSVALKLIAPELASQEDFRKRFLRESRLAASLDHGNVIPIYEAGEEDGRLFLAMRYVDGRDLKALLGRQGTLQAERALSIVGRVADALDAAHAKGLIHRDVKPGNVLLDERGHPYLTDFGLTKEAGGTSTQTGHIVGTLDYLAPEQIRGEEVDARTDEYALACLLYECLSGKPPFRRPTEAEVLWAHMQEEPPGIREYPALDPVLAKGLAKDRAERYPSCGDFIAAAHSALGLETPAVRGRRRRLGRRLVGVGAALVAAAGIAAGVVLLTADESSALAAPPPNAVVQIDADASKPVAEVAVGSNPTALAIGQGAVWALNADDQTISRIDSETKTQKTFSVGTTPTDLAVGEGSVWIGNGVVHKESGFPGPVLSSVSRVDPDTFSVLGTSKLQGKGARAVPGDSLVVGKGAIWAINPDGTVSRLDPQSGRVVARVPTSVIEIAAGPDGVLWGMQAPPRTGLVRVSPASNTVTATIRIASEGLTDIAVGAGAVWVGDGTGSVWRIDLGRRARQRTIAVAKGVDSLAFGSGFLWAVNPFEGTLARIDPSTNEVSKTIAIGGTPRDVTAGEGSLWVSDAGASCGKPLYEGDGEPKYLVVSDLALQTPGNREMAKAIELVFRKRGFRAGKYRVAYQSCDDSTSQVGLFDVLKCAANAKSYAAGASVIGVVGTFNSGCALSEIPFLNQAPDGPLAMVSPTNSYIGLTRRDPFAEKGELEALYPTGVRSFARVSPIDDVAGAGAALFVKRMGARRVAALSDRDGYSDYLVNSFRVAAGRIGLGFAGVSTFSPEAKDYSALVARLKRARVDGVYIGGYLFGNTGKLIKELRAQLGPRVQIVTGDGFLPASGLVKALGPTARTLYITLGVGAGERQLSPAGRSFLKDFLAAERKSTLSGLAAPYAMYAAQAAEVMLDAIARSDGTRASVTRELMMTRAQNGFLGSFRFDRNGDTNRQRMTILRPVGAAAKRDRLGIEGTDVVRVIDVPPSLLP